MASAYRTNQLKDNTQNVRLEFDGDELEPDDEVQNTELTDLDCVEVHVL